MMDDPGERRVLALVGCGLAGFFLAVWTYGVVLKPNDPNVELARTARKAVEMAEEARRDAQSVRRTNSALRLVALAAGVCVPLLIALVNEEPVDDGPSSAG